MRILWCQTVPYLPEDHGGGLSNTHALCLALKRRGCAVAVFSGRGPHRYSIRSFWSANPELGYPVVRASDPLREIEAQCNSFKPDVAIVQFGDIAGIIAALNKLGVPSLVYFHDIFSIPASVGAATAYAACSSVVAKVAASTIGSSVAVVPVLVEASDYKVPRGGTSVTLVNPVPRKGIETAFALASRRPDIHFEFIEAWRLRSRVVKYLKTRLAHHGNISFRPRSTGMKEVYQRTRLVIAPSLWVEAWGRVVSEAQVSGIPALASDSGGLPEAVGPGGTIVARDAPIESWAAALDRLWDDHDFYERKSTAALAYAQRSEFQPGVIVDRLLAVLGNLKRC